MRYRPHRGSLDKAMAEVADVKDFGDLVQHLRKTAPSWYPRDEMPTESNVKVQPYAGPDERIVWDATFLVTVKGSPWGFIDGPCERVEAL